MKPQTIYQRRYRQRLRARLVAQLGGKCRDCSGFMDLEFSHTRPTGLSGMGRGMSERLNDVRKHPDCYTLLCRRCHVIFDNQGEAA